MSYQYTYLLMGLTFFVIWILLFVWKKHSRKEMLFMSILFGVAGPLADVVYTQDWWKPWTIIGNSIGFEAVLVGFVIGGIASVIYGEIFNKKVRIKKASEIKKDKRNINFVFIISLLVVLFFGSFYLFKLNSLNSTILAFAIPTLIIWVKRNDLIKNSFLSGILLIFVAIIVYSILEILTPRWIDAFWYFENVPNIIILNLPLDDLIWYFLAGMFIGPLYEYWKEGKLINAK